MLTALFTLIDYAVILSLSSSSRAAFWILTYFPQAKLGTKGSGEPKGNPNALTHGYTARTAKTKRKEIKEFLKLCKKLQKEII